MVDEVKPLEAFKCSECTGSFALLFDLQRHNLMTHMAGRELPPRLSEPAAPSIAARRMGSRPSKRGRRP
jgi:hypothetical protein